jgi:hypothetical protein
LDCRHVYKTCAFHNALQAGKQKEVHSTPLIWRLRALDQGSTVCIFCFVCFLVPFTEHFRHTTYNNYIADDLFRKLRERSMKYEIKTNIPYNCHTLNYQSNFRISLIQIPYIFVRSLLITYCNIRTQDKRQSDHNPVYIHNQSKEFFLYLSQKCTLNVAPGVTFMLKLYNYQRNAPG